MVVVLVDFGNGSGDEGGLGSRVGDGQEVMIDDVFFLFSDDH